MHWHRIVQLSWVLVPPISWKQGLALHFKDFQTIMKSVW